MNFDFLKDRYDLELDRRDTLTGALALPTGVITGLGGLIALMARSFSYSDGRVTWLFGIFIVADTAAFAVCLWHLTRAYHGQTYELLPRLRELADAERAWIAWAEQGNADDESLTFDEQLERRIIAAADHNADSNDRRQAYLHRANITLFIVLVLTALSGVPYVFDQATIRFRMTRSNEQTPPPQPTPRPQSQTPPPPPFPPNRVIREGQPPPPPDRR